MRTSLPACARDLANWQTYHQVINDLPNILDRRLGEEATMKSGTIRRPGVPTVGIDDSKAPPFNPKMALPTQYRRQDGDLIPDRMALFRLAEALQRLAEDPCNRISLARDLRNRHTATNRAAQPPVNEIDLRRPVTKDDSGRFRVL